MKKFCLPLVAASLLFTACEKKEPVIQVTDVLAPELAVSGLHDSKRLVGEEQLQIKATDDGGIEKVEVFLGADLISSHIMESFEVHINSTEFEDGEYELKVVAYDEAGNSKKWKQVVNVSNTLLVIKTDQLYNDGFAAHYFLVSDPDGKPLSSSAIQIGEVYTIQSPDDFYGLPGISMLMTYKSNYKLLLVKSITEVERGTSIQPKERIGEKLGTYEIEVSNMEGGILSAAGKDGSQRDIWNGKLTSVGVFENPLDVILIKNPSSSSMEEPAYQLLENVQLNDEVKVDYGTISSPFETKTISLPAASYANVRANGFSSKGDKVKLLSGGEKLYYLPTAIFPEHGVTVWLDGTVDGNSHIMYKRADNPAELTFEPLNINIAGRKTADNLSWDITGDEFNFNFGGLIGESADAFIEWHLFAPVERKSILLPEFTEELQVVAAEFGNYRELELQAAGGMKFPSGNKAQKDQNMIEYLTDIMNGSKNDFLFAYKPLGPGANGRLSTRKWMFEKF